MSGAHMSALLYGSLSAMMATARGGSVGEGGEEGRRKEGGGSKE